MYIHICVYIYIMHMCIYLHKPYTYTSQYLVYTSIYKFSIEI